MVNKILAAFGVKLVRTTTLNVLDKLNADLLKTMQENAMPTGLSRLSKHFNFTTIIDVGAASGVWSEKSVAVFPKAKHILIDPIEVSLNKAKANFAGNSNVYYEQVIAGNEEKQVGFSISDDLDGSGVYENANTTVKQIRLDSLPIDGNSVLIKLDTHGYEVPILEGITNIASKVDALIIEIYGFHITSSSLLFHQMSEYVYKMGFRLYDVVDTMRRKSDDAFWQADAIYVKADHPIFSNNRYDG